MEFEEGEVDDVSDVESEHSPAPKPNDNKGSKPKHSRHHTKRKHARGSTASDHRSSSKMLKLNGVQDHNGPAKEAKNNTKHKSTAPKHKAASSNRKRNEPQNKHHKRRRRPERFSKPVVQLRCRYFMEGRCSKGDSCPFAHDFEPPRKQELCKFYASGVCSKGSTCIYLHEEFPCKFFHVSGRCNQGNACKFSHAPLTPQSRALLDNAMRKMEPSPELDFESTTDHGDVDYRLKRRPQFGQPLYPPESNSPQPDYSEPNSTATNYNEYPEPRHLMGPWPRFPFHPHDNHFGVNEIDTPARPPYYPSRFPLGGIPEPYMNRPMIPRYPRPDRAMIMRPTLNFHPQGMPPESIRVPNLRPPFCPAPLPFTPPPLNHPTDLLVSTELDKMAALLASNKPPTTTCAISPPSDPRAHSPPTVKTEKSPSSENIQSPQKTTPSQTIHPQSPSVLMKANLCSPEVNTMNSRSSNAIGSPNHIPWRLIQLDMTVKIPYPLMQLSVEDLPHRFEDPRLRGVPTTMRLQAKPQSKIASNVETKSAMTLSEPSAEVAPTETVDPCIPVPRKRPFKLQLNEMSSTFANTQASQTSNPSTKVGDRSYLDDPRFRRRRIIAAPSQPELPSTPTNATCFTTQ